MITFTRKGIRFSEVWFEDAHQPTDSDVLLLYQVDNPVSDTCKDFYSIEVSLASEPDALLAAFKRDTRYEVNRAANKDNLTFDFHSAVSPALLDEFCAFFDAFAESRQLSRSNPEWLGVYAEAGALCLSRVCDSDGNSLVWHSYYRDPKWCRLLQSASEFRASGDPQRRNLLGRANRYQHWRDMVAFRELGNVMYDFGGWYEGKTDEQKLRINQFKEEFGGVINHRYHCTKVLTAKAKAFFWARSLKDRSADRFLHMA
jgi:hypothetical protein